MEITPESEVLLQSFEGALEDIPFDTKKFWKREHLASLEGSKLPGLTNEEVKLLTKDTELMKEWWKYGSGLE
ncbi:MAG: hypothetical protein CL932_00310 [Deltaproteobacteria bacterium]|nr:hypothetical protein [Deltaproteobacteria bacterium]|tara:strand:+ start:697 stop:912 length:216 start_codon:yes stop_codon:yes gene_type:complete